jgi:hypothetical protein
MNKNYLIAALFPLATYLAYRYITNQENNEPQQQPNNVCKTQLPELPPVIENKKHDSSTTNDAERQHHEIPTTKQKDDHIVQQDHHKIVESVTKPCILLLKKDSYVIGYLAIQNFRTDNFHVVADISTCIHDTGHYIFNEICVLISSSNAVCCDQVESNKIVKRTVTDQRTNGFEASVAITGTYPSGAGGTAGLVYTHHSPTCSWNHSRNRN